MGLFTFLLILQSLVAACSIIIILMQRSEGGGLAGGGSPAGMMSARGASDFLTRGTAILATIFVALSILLAALAAGAAHAATIDPNLARPTAPGPAPRSTRRRHRRPRRPSRATANQSGVPLAQYARLRRNYSASP